MVRMGVAFDWPSRYVEVLARLRDADAVQADLDPGAPTYVSPSVTPTTLPVKSSARAGDAHLLPPPAP
jgi:hypothetical protein